MRWLLAVLLFSFAANVDQWTVVPSGIDTNLRGVSAIAGHDSTGSVATIVWASGSNGVILRWSGLANVVKRLHVQDGEALDFRGIRAFDEKTAYLMSSGEGDKSRIYKTIDGGETWKLQYTDKRPTFFLDTLICSSRVECLALGDPIDGKFVLLRTEDGERWTEIARDTLPAVIPGEGAFAASNTSLAICGSDIYWGTGGGRAARVFHSRDMGRAWTVTETPMASGNASSGIFSVACDGKAVIAVGGDYKDPNRSSGTAAYSRDSGATWNLASNPPGGYRSAVALLGGPNLIAAGPNGEDTSNDYGAHWTHSGSFDLNAIFFTNKNKAWAVGAKGKIARLDVPR